MPPRGCTYSRSITGKSPKKCRSKKQHDTVIQRVSKRRSKRAEAVLSRRAKTFVARQRTLDAANPLRSLPDDVKRYIYQKSLKSEPLILDDSEFQHLIMDLFDYFLTIRRRLRERFVNGVLIQTRTGETIYEELNIVQDRTYSWHKLGEDIQFRPFADPKHVYFEVKVRTAAMGDAVLKLFSV